MPAFSPDELRRILESGLLAPSADNRHPWIYETGGDTLELWHRDKPPTDYRRTLSLLSLGAVAENLLIAAASIAHSGGDIEVYPDPTQPRLALRILWHANGGDPRRASLYDAIPWRHTNRRPIFHGPPLRSDQRLQLEQYALEASGVLWLDEPVVRAAAAKLIAAAERERFRRQALHAELFAMVRFDVGWTATCDEGIPPGALGIEPPLRPLFALLRYWPVMRAFNMIGGDRLLGWRAAGLPCRLAPNAGVITASRLDNSALLATGQTLQRIWLCATQRGFALQPLPASTLYALPDAHPPGVTPALQQRLADGWARLCPGVWALVPFRIGRAAVPAVTAARPPLDARWSAARKL